MRKLTWIAVLLAALPVLASQEPATHESRWLVVDLGGGLADDLLHPEGRTRWDLASLPLGAGWTRTLELSQAGTLVLRDRGGSTVFLDLRASDPEGGDAAERWLLPQRDDALLDSSGDRSLEIVQTSNRLTEELRIETRRVGLGWLSLPAGPREVVLQRARISVRSGASWVPQTIEHRWVDPRIGVVARVWGPVAADGFSRQAIRGAEVMEASIRGGTPLKIYADELDHPVPPAGGGSVPGMHFRLAYGYDVVKTCVGTTTPCVDLNDCGGSACEKHIESLTTPPAVTAGDLIAQTSWDFTPLQLSLAETEIASTTAPINSDETCSFDQCGFDQPNAKLTREDRGFDDAPNSMITVNSQEREDRAGDVTLWLRGVVNNEGVSGGLGSGESRVCHVGGGREDVPLWRFGHQDGVGQPFYLQNGDTWTHTPFACTNNIFNHVCPNSCGLFCAIYVAPCGTHTGTQGSEVVGEGPITLPSGHTLNSLLVKNTADFCVYLGASCGADVDRVRTVVYQWVVPWLGTVARIQSPQFVNDPLSFTTLDLTDVKFGLFPPRSITAGTVTDTSVSISWDPGTVTHRIDGYKIYWDTDSGVSTDYAFNSQTHGGQVAINGTTAVISGLDSGTEYFFTVTALSDYANSSSGVLNSYESLLYPLTVSGTSSGIPAEVSATTGGGLCTPTDEVTGVTVGRVSGGTIEMCWNPSLDACTDGYQIIGATDPGSAPNFSVVVADTGLVTCHTFNPSESYFLVLTKGTGGTGPWGHHGQ